MKKLFVIVQTALSMLLALSSFAQPISWNNESTRIRPRPVLRADEGLGVNDRVYYGGYNNFMDPRWSTIIRQRVLRADEGLGVNDWRYEVYPRRNRRVYYPEPPYGQNRYGDQYDHLRHYYNQPPPDYRFSNQGTIQFLQPPGYYSLYRQRPSNVTIILDALLNPRR